MRWRADWVLCYSRAWPEGTLPATYYEGSTQGLGFRVFYSSAFGVLLFIVFVIIV